MKKIFSIIYLCALCVNVFSQTTATVTPTWYDNFKSPSVDAKPWNFWYWMYGCVTDDGIKADLNAMHDAGIVGFFLMPIKDTDDGKDYAGSSRQLSSEWWKRMDTVFSTADSLGLQMGIHFCDGFALAGGPWITPAESMQKVVWSDTIVKGGKQVLSLPQPVSYEDYYEDIAVYAYPAEYVDESKPISSVDLPLSSSEPCDIVFSYDKPFTLRNVKIITGGNNYQAHRYKVYASDNGTDYTFIKEISPARQGWQNTDAYATYAVSATTAKYFKFCWSPEGSDPGSEDMDAAKWKPNLKVGNILLGSEPVIDGYEGKSGVVWRVSKYFGVSDSECVDMTKVINLTDQFLASKEQNKAFSIKLPKGNWHILRMGHTSTGHTNATGGGARGLECNKFSRNIIDKQFANWWEAIYNHAPKNVAKRVLTRLHVDSWECGSQNWSDNFADEFQQRRGYDLLPWLPVLAGVPLESSEKSETVLRDVRLTIAELINDVFFDEVEKLSKKYGCKLTTECVAPTMVSDGLLHYQHADYPMGEFWLNSPTHDKPNDMLDAVSGAHIYGKNIILAEGFTEVRGTWDEHPGMLKALLDRNFCLGINGLVFHVNTHNPWLDRAPGMTLDGIGTFFQRDNTWWNEMPAFTDYISRCQALLQYGSPVVDLAVYTGDETPRRAILPERLVTTLPGLFGKEAIARENERLANVGQPLETSPVGVTHTKNMTKADMWTNPLHGYRYDSFNHDVLSKAKVENGELVTADGMRYSALIIPQERKMNPDRIVNCWDDIAALAVKGAKVICDPWTEDDLSSLSISRDIVLPEGLDYIHRHGKDADIYFISNQLDKTVTFTPTLRAERANRYLADAVTGNIYMGKDEITLTSHASIFVILSDSELITELISPERGKTISQPLGNHDWKMVFEKTGKCLTTETLEDWTQMDDNSMKFYSGHVSYETTFNYEKNDDAQVFINLGDVENIATVYVNGENCGTLWFAPYAVDITNAVKDGDNELKIVVVNTWANALQGNDEGTPPFDGIWTNAKYRRSSKTLLPSGLLGPVMLETSHIIKSE